MGSTLVETGASRRGRPQRPAAPLVNQGQTRTPGFPGGGPPRAPAQGHPARRGQGGGAEPDLPAVGGGGDRPGPSHGSASASPRGRGGAGAPGLRRRRGPWERAAGPGPGRGRAGAGRGGAGGGARLPGGERALSLGNPEPLLAMKRPREPSGSDSESDGPIDVGREGELR